MSEPMKKLSIWLCVLLFMISAESRAQSMISGATYEKRCDAMIQYMAKGTSPSGGDPKYTGPYYFARLYLNYDKSRAINNLEAMYDKYIADPDLYYNSTGSGVEFYAHATLHGYLLTKDNMPESLKAKIKTFLQLGDYNSRGITLNLDMIRYTVGFMATEQWSDFTDRYGRTTKQIRDYNRPRILNWLNKFFHNNCSEADAFIYFSTNIMYVRMLAEFCQDEEINQKANVVYQQMIASLLSAWNQGLYVANPPRCKGWDQLYTGARASNSNITALAWLYFGNQENKYLFIPGLTVTNNTASMNFWLAYKRNVAPDPALLQVYDSKEYPYVYTSYINDIGVNGSNKDVLNWKRFKYTYQSNNYGLATQTEIPYDLSKATSCYAYKETKRTYLAWQSDVVESVFSVCQDNPARPTDNTNANIEGYGENPYHRVMQYEKAAVGVYNVPTTYIQGKRYRIYVPFTKRGIKERIEADGWIFCHTGTMLFAFKTLEPYTWANTDFVVSNHDVLTLEDTSCRKGAWVLETSEIEPEYKAATRSEELELFKNAVLTKTKIEKQDYTTSKPAVKYTSLSGDVLQLQFFPPTEAYQDNYKVNGVPLALSEEYLFNSPYVQQKNDADELFVYKNGVLEKTISWNDSSVGIENAREEAGYHLFPNPVKDEFHLSFPQEDKPERVSIVSLSGQVVRHWNIQEEYEQTVTLSAVGLYEGLYFLRVDNGKKVCMLKFLKI
ncbi:T9SS type A sorting domain-containing protein [Bacteroides sp. K03]|nr:T9SS type A sorting domain-containing protein [Bacteroides sp. K03]